MRTKKFFLFLGIFLIVLGISISILSGYNFSYSETRNEEFPYTYNYVNRQFEKTYNLYGLGSPQAETTLVANDVITVYVTIT